MVGSDIQRHHPLVVADRHHRPLAAVGIGGKMKALALEEMAQRGAGNREFLFARHHPAGSSFSPPFFDHAHLQMEAPQEGVRAIGGAASTEPEMTLFSPSCSSPASRSSRLAPSVVLTSRGDVTCGPPSAIIRSRLPVRKSFAMAIASLTSARPAYSGSPAPESEYAFPAAPPGAAR